MRLCLFTWFCIYVVSCYRMCSLMQEADNVRLCLLTCSSGTVIECVLLLRMCSLTVSVDVLFSNCYRMCSLT